MDNKKSTEKTSTNKKSLMVAVIAGAIVVAVVIGIVVGEQLAKKKTENANTITVKEGEAVDYQKIGNVSLGEYKGVKISLAVTDSDVKEEMDYLLEENADVEQLTGKVKEGDTINMDYKGTIDGTAFEGGTEEDSELTIGDGEFIEGFEEALVGVKTGDTKTFKVTFPDDYGDEALDGKEAEFTVTVNYIVGDTIDTPFDDAFVQKISEGEYKTVDEYKNYIRTYLRQDNEDAAADTVWEKVIENAEVEQYDEDELESAIKEAREMYENFAEASGTTYEDLLAQFGMTDEDVESTASDAVLERMVAKTIASIEKLEVTEDYYRKALISALEYEEDEDMTIEELERDYTDSYASSPKEDMLVQRVKDFCKENAVIEDGEAVE